MDSSGDLILPDLRITGLMGIEDLTIPRLGRVTLLAGANGIGKSTVLDAVGIYASRGRRSRLISVLNRRGESQLTAGQDGRSYRAFNWPALFHGRTMNGKQTISIGSAANHDTLTIEVTYPDDEEYFRAERWYQTSERYVGTVYSPEELRVMRAVHNGAEQERFIVHPEAGEVDPPSLRRSKRRVRGGSISNDGHDALPLIGSPTLGPGLASDLEMSKLWDMVVLAADERRVVRPLSSLSGNDINRIATVGDVDPIRRTGRRVLVKLEDHAAPVPLRSLGDGTLRLFSVTSTLATSKGGFLLIDEAENGLHYSILWRFWQLVFETAYENDIQVLATTHSWDCIRGFAYAAVENGDTEGVLVRLSRSDDGLKAVEYREEVLSVAAENRIEVR